MSRRKRWKLDLLSGEAAALVLLGASFFLGGAAGCVMAGLVGGEGQGALAEYIRGYLDLAAEGGMQPPFWPLVWELIRFPLLVFLLGFTALGVVGMPVLFAVRGFLLCFGCQSCSSWESRESWPPMACCGGGWGRGAIRCATADAILPGAAPVRWLWQCA